MTELLSRRESNKLEKERCILTAALRVFSSQGYTGAALDRIAAEAGVSKPTLYQYFGNKEGLFSAVLDDAKAQLLQPFTATAGKSMVKVLLDFGFRYADFVLRPDLLSLARLVIGEAERFPEIGRNYHRSGPQRALEGIIAYLKTLAAEGKLEIEDFELAANDLWSLILSTPRDLYLHIPDLAMSQAEINRYLFNGIRVFLKAYSTNIHADLAELADLKAKAATA